MRKEEKITKEETKRNVGEKENGRQKEVITEVVEKGRLNEKDERGSR